MTIYRGVDINTSATPAPWGNREEAVIKSILDTLVVDTLKQTSATTGHYHNKIYATSAGVIALSATSAGNINIGSLVTTSNKLQVGGDIAIDGAYSFKSMNSNNIQFNSDSGAVDFYSWTPSYLRVYNPADPTYPPISLAATTNGNSWVSTTLANGTAGGNFGVGTNNPEAKLHVSGTAIFSGVVSGVMPTLSNHLATKGYIDGLSGLSAAALSNLGLGTINYVSKYITTSSFGNSQIFDNGTNVGIRTISPSANFHVSGTAVFNNAISGVTPTLSNHLATKGYVDSISAAGISNLGLGTSGYIPKYITTSSFGNSIMYENATGIGIGTGGIATEKLLVSGGNIGIAGGYAFKSTGGTNLIFTSDSGAVDFFNGAMSSYLRVYNPASLIYPPISLAATTGGSSWVAANLSNGTDSGLFGVGTIAPITKFHVSGTSIFSTNVGIGVTSAPTEKLQIHSTPGLASIIALNSVSASSVIKNVSGSIAIQCKDSGSSCYIGDVASYYDQVRIAGNLGGSARPLSILYNAVGIGTDTPSATFDVRGNVRIQTIADVGASTGKTLVSDNGIIKYRSDAGVLSDIGAASATHNHGLGTSGYIPKYITTSSFGNSQIFDNGTNVGISVNPACKFQIALSGTSGLSDATITNLSAFGATSRAGFNNLTNLRDGVFFGIGANGTIPAGLGFFREATGWNTAIALYTNNITSGPDGTSAIQEKVRITSNGYVGIGTSIPGARLHVTGTAIFDGVVSGVTPTVSSHLATKGYVDSVSATSANHSHSSLAAFDGTPNPALSVNVDGYVGIGTSTPIQKLHVSGIGYFSDITNSTENVTIFNDHAGTMAATAITLTDGATLSTITAEGNGSLSYARNKLNLINDKNGVMITASHGSLGTISFLTGGSTSAVERMKIDRDGQITISPITDAGTDTDKFLVSDSGIIKYRTGAEVLSDIGGANTTHTHSKLVASDGSPDPALSIDAAGNVGIGTATPTEMLEIEKTSTNDNIFLSLINNGSFTTNKLNSIVFKEGPTTIDGAIGVKPDVVNQTVDFVVHSLYNGGVKTTTDRSFIIKGNGNVGIGTEPVGALHIVKNTTTSPTTGIRVSVGNQTASTGTWTQDNTEPFIRFNGIGTLGLGGSELVILPDYGNSFGYNKCWAGELSLQFAPNGNSFPHGYVSYRLYSVPSGGSPVQTMVQLYYSASGLSGYFANTDTPGWLCLYVKSNPDSTHSSTIAIKNNHAIYSPRIMWNFEGTVM